MVAASNTAFQTPPSLTSVPWVSNGGVVGSVMPSASPTAAQRRPGELEAALEAGEVERIERCVPSKPTLGAADQRAQRQRLRLRLRAFGEEAEHAGGAEVDAHRQLAGTGRPPSGAGRFRRARGARSRRPCALPAAPPARMTMPLLAAPLGARRRARGRGRSRRRRRAAGSPSPRRALPSLSAKRASMPAGSTSSTYSTWPSPTREPAEGRQRRGLLAGSACSSCLPNCHEARPSARRSSVRVERRAPRGRAMCSGAPCQARQRSR